MVTDRTAADVQIAIELLNQAKSGHPLSSSMKNAIERGTCTITMLNRIESKQKELADLLNSYRYMVNITNKTNWTYSDIFTYHDHERLLNNLDKLKQAFYIYQSTPTTPDYLYNYENANDVEKILVDIESMIENMQKNFRRCNTFRCGQRRKK